jgi:hypothetical protein
MTTPAIAKPKPTAATIRQINDAHDAIVNSARDGLQSAIRAGELLAAVKEGQDHGDWETWLKNNCPKISPRTARLYILAMQPASIAQFTANSKLQTPSFLRTTPASNGR